MIFVLDKIKIASDKIFFVLNKKFCTWIKSSSLVMNCMKNDFLALDKIFVLDFVQDNFYSVLNKNNFVQADGLGIRFNHVKPLIYFFIKWNRYFSSWQVQGHQEMPISIRTFWTAHSYTCGIFKWNFEINENM